MSIQVLLSLDRVDLARYGKTLKTKDWFALNSDSFVVWVRKENIQMPFWMSYLTGKTLGWLKSFFVYI